LAITSLNPQEFGKDLAQQAINYMPAEFSEEQKNYIAKKVFNFCILAGNHLLEKFNEHFNDEQARIIVQFIGEWTFHKGIDLIRADIPSENWEEILQQVAFAALQMAIQSFAEGHDQNKIAAIIENHVILTYQNCINNLKQNGILTEEKAQLALTTSNVDLMAKEAGGAGVNALEDEEKTLKYASIAIVLQKMSREKVNKILENFNEEEQQFIQGYLNIENLEQKLDPALAYQYLADLKKNMASVVKPKMLEVVTNIKALSKEFTEEEIFNTISYERGKVLDFIETCIFEKTSKAVKVEFSPYIAKILYSYIKSKLVKQA